MASGTIKSCIDKAVRVPLLTVRIPEALRKRMRQLRGVNWSDWVRHIIRERVERELASRAKDRRRIRKAIRIQRTAAKRLRATDEWKGVEVIRYWREHRYSSSTRR